MNDAAVRARTESGAQQEFVTAKEAAERYRVSEQFFAVRRIKKGKYGRSDGPPWIKVGRRVVYHLPTLDRYFAERGQCAGRL